MKVKNIVKFIIPACIALAATVAYAAGSNSGSGTAPTINQGGDHEFIQTNIYVSGPLSSAPITNVSWTYQYHKICLSQPVGGGCTWMNGVQSHVYLCMTTQQGTPYPQSDLACLEITGTFSGNSSRWNGYMVNSTTKKPRWYFTFYAPGDGSALSPVWQGQGDSVTMTW